MLELLALLLCFASLFKSVQWLGAKSLVVPPKTHPV